MLSQGKLDNTLIMLYVWNEPQSLREKEKVHVEKTCMLLVDLLGKDKVRT